MQIMQLYEPPPVDYNRRQTRASLLIGSNFLHILPPFPIPLLHDPCHLPTPLLHPTNGQDPLVAIICSAAAALPPHLPKQFELLFRILILIRLNLGAVD